jgi:alpha-methylacyl-CoA racemase
VEPLTGLRVVELAGLAPAPFGTMILGDLGADVLRIDRPNTATGVPRGTLDRNKRSVTVDLKSPAGVAVVQALAERADVLVEGFRPGVVERLGIGPGDLTDINERLIFARLSGWGQTGPLADVAGHDINYIALAGALDAIGPTDGKPVVPLNLVGDFAGGGMLMVIGILAALHARESTGRGQIVDAAMIDGASLLMSLFHGLHAAGLWSDRRGTNLLDGGAAVYDTYATSDRRFVAVGALEPDFFAELWRRLGLQDSERPDHLDPATWPAIRSRLADVFSTRTREEWTQIFADTDACVTPVLTPWEAPAHEHHRARQSFVEIDRVVQPAPAPRFSSTPLIAPRPLDAGGRAVVATLVDWGLDHGQASLWYDDGTVA